jgi:hypothetical protein
MRRRSQKVIIDGTSASTPVLEIILKAQRMLHWRISTRAIWLFSGPEMQGRARLANRKEKERRFRRAFGLPLTYREQGFSFALLARPLAIFIGSNCDLVQSFRERWEP